MPVANTLRTLGTAGVAIVAAALLGSCGGSTPAAPSAAASPSPTPIPAASLDQHYEPVRVEPVGISGIVVGAQICETRYSGAYLWAQTFTPSRVGLLREVELQVYPFTGSTPTLPNQTYEIGIVPDPFAAGSRDALAIGRFSSNAVLAAGTDPRNPACTPNCHTWVRVVLDRGVPVNAGQRLAIVAYRPAEGCWAWVDDKRGTYADGTDFEWYEGGQAPRGRGGDMGFRTYQ